MTAAVSRPPAWPDTLAQLADASRRALEADALLVVDDDHGVLAAPGAEPSSGPLLAPGSDGAPPPGFGAVHAVELRVDERRLGTLQLLRRAPVPFGEDELVAPLAGQIALQLALRRCDPLPGAVLREMARALDRLPLAAATAAELSVMVDARVAQWFPGVRTGVMLADPTRKVLELQPGAFDGEKRPAPWHRVSFFDVHSHSARVLATGAPACVNAVEDEPALRREYAEGFPIRRLLSLPLGRLGVLHLANAETDFTVEDVQRAELLAERIAVVVETATTLSEMRRQQRLEEILANAAFAVASAAPIDEILPRALQELCEATRANLVAFVSDGAPPVISRTGRQHAGHERRLLEEAASLPGVRAYVVEQPEGPDPARAVFHAPVHLGERRLGTIAAMRLDGEPFSRIERRTFGRAAALAALARAGEHYVRQGAELARLQERQRIADDLHDDVAQILFASQLCLDAILQTGDELDDAVAAQVARARGLLIRGDTAIRTVIERLSSPPPMDLGARLAAAVLGVEDEFSLVVRLDVDEAVAGGLDDLPRPAGDALVRVAREALVNAAKHAGPCSVRVSLSAPEGDRLALAVEDDGVGLGPISGEHHHGLQALSRLMREQGGGLQVTGAPGRGTRVLATLPYPVGAPR